MDTQASHRDKPCECAGVRPVGEGFASQVRVRRGVGTMTPAEVIAMRDKLAEGIGQQQLSSEGIADWLIESGWVVAPPKNKGENNE